MIRWRTGSGSSSSAYSAATLLADPLLPDAAIGKYSGARTFSDSSGAMKLHDTWGYYSLAAEASTLSYPSASNISAASGSMSFSFTPTASTSGTVYLFGSTVDSNNGTYILHDGTNLIFRKRIAGVNYDTSRAFAYVTGVTYEIAVSWGTSGTRVSINGQASVKNADTSPLQLATTMQIAADGAGANQPNAYTKLLNDLSTDFSGGTTTGRTVLGNRNVLPYTNTLTLQRHRAYRMKKRVANNADYTDVKLTWSNWVASSTNETITGYPAQYVGHSINYNGVNYPATYGGQSMAVCAAGSDIESDIIPGLALLRGTEYEECGYVILPLLYKTKTADFTVGQVVTGGTSGAVGTIAGIEVVSGTTGKLTLTTETGTFVDGEALTDPLGGSALVDLTTNQQFAVSMGTLNLWLEGAINSNTASSGYLTSNPVATRMVPGAITINGSGNITSVATATAGVGYTSASTVAAYEVHNGIIYSRNIGNTNTGHTSITITNGIPPVGLSAWTNPTIVICSGGDFGITTSCSTCSLTTGIPSVPVKSIAFAGDSIMRGFSSADANGDEYHNYGFHERALANRCGSINAAISSGTASAFADYTTKYPRTYSLYFSGITTHARIALGINDITGGASKASLENNLNIIRAKFLTYGLKTAFTKYVPCTSGAWSNPDLSDQTPKTGCAAGGVLDLVNADMSSGVLVSDFTLCDPYLIVVAAADPNKWDVTIAWTTDGTHPSGYTGIVGLASNASIQASYNAIA